MRGGADDEAGRFPEDIDERSGDAGRFRFARPLILMKDSRAGHESDADEKAWYCMCTGHESKNPDRPPILL